MVNPRSQVLQTCFFFGPEWELGWADWFSEGDVEDDGEVDWLESERYWEEEYWE